MRRKPLLAKFLLFCSISLPLTGQAFAVEEADEADLFRKGTQAFKAADHETALEYFQRAAEGGYRSNALTYNLAVTHYRLGDYGLARRYFTQLIDETDWRDLVRYNLGLVAQRLDEEQRAVEWFRLVSSEADNEKLRLLAAQRLDELSIAEPSRPEDGEGHVLLSVIAGYDDNVLAFPDQLQQNASQGRDTFTELLAYGQAWAYGDSSNGILAHGFGFTRRYQDHDIFDTSAVGGGINRQQAMGDWYLEYGLALSRTSVGGVELSTETQLNIRAWMDDKTNRYVLYYRPGSHRAGDEYPQLDGSTQRLGAKWRHTRGDWRWHAAYLYERDDRQDLNVDGMFFSYSPTRHRLEFRTDWQASPRWSWTAGLSVGRAQYDGENRLIDLNGETRIAQRETDTLQVWLRNEYRVTDRWRVSAQWRRTDSDDTFDLYAYERNVFQLGLEYGF